MNTDILIEFCNRKTFFLFPTSFKRTKNKQRDMKTILKLCESFSTIQIKYPNWKDRHFKILILHKTLDGGCKHSRKMETIWISSLYLPWIGFKQRTKYSEWKTYELGEYTG